MVRTVPEHRRAVLQLLRPVLAGLGSESVELAAARSRVLAGTVNAPVSLPGFDNAQMDGYAVRLDDLTPGAAGGAAPTVELIVADSVAAGSAPQPLAAGFAAPIMTGAMLPDGAGAVIPIERAIPDSFYSHTDEQHRPTVVLPAETPAGQYVRTAGSDIAAGSAALPAGKILGAPQLALLAALGLAEVSVRRRPTVLLLCTGDEVVAPGQPLLPGQIYDANTTLLRAALQEAGAEVITTEPLTDAPESFLRRLREELSLRRVDVILTAGGISQGAFEVVRQALSGEGVQFLSVAMQPGGPQGIGTVEGVPFLGFPGNPVSALVSLEMFLRPVLGSLTGFPAPRAELAATLAEGLSSPAGKYQLRRGVFSTDGKVRLVGGASSHLVHALAEANALIHLPAGITELAAGDRVPIWLLDNPVFVPPATTARRQ